MTISMSDILCVTNRTLCAENFLTRLERIAAAHPAGIILREKDLPEAEYEAMARRVLEIYRSSGVPCILHTFVPAALRLRAEAIHLPLPVLRQLTEAEKAQFSVLGASCHSVADALEAQRLGCTYITAGHIFATDCKKGLEPHGLDFLRSVCRSVNIPTYAIGGICPGNIRAVRDAGAQGGCVMSGLMTCQDPRELLEELHRQCESNTMDA